MTTSPASVFAPQPDPAAGIERRSILILLLVMLPLLTGLFYWLTLPVPQRLHVGGLAQAYADPTGRLTLEDLQERGELFPSASGDPANLGVRSTPQTAFWLRLPLASLRAAVPAGASVPLVLSMEEPRFRQVDLYIVGQDGSTAKQSFRRNGEAPYRFPVFLISAQALAGDALYARIVTASSMRATLYVAPAAQFAASYGRSAIGLAALLGMMVASVAYLAPLGLVLRRTIYLSLAAAMLFAALYVASDQALLETYILPGAVAVSRAVSLSAVVMFYGTFLIFSVRFLQLGRRVRRAMDGLAIVFLVIGFAAFADGWADTGLLRRTMPYIGLGAGCVLAALLGLSTLNAPRRALLYAVLWVPLVATGLARVLLDISPGHGADAVALNGVYFGLALSLLLFAVVTPLELYRRELELRRRAQALLERLESFARIGRDIYIEADRHGRVVYLSGDHASEKIRNIDAAPESVTANSLPTHVQTALADAVLEHRPLRNSILPVGEGEARRWFSLSGTPSEDNSNFRAILRDVTAEIEQENRRQQEQHLISLGSLAAMVAHEINNVVQPIVNMSKGLRTQVGTMPGAGRMLDLIDLASRQAIELVEQILKIGARRTDASSADRQIDLAVHDALATLQLILPSDVSLASRIEPIAEVKVRAGDILQILTNVVANARRALGDNGSIRIELTAVPKGALLAVIDHGDGMSAALAARASEPYVSTKSEGRASGIGLMVVKQLVTRHGGTLSINSRPGSGTEIIMFFPAANGEDLP